MGIKGLMKFLQDTAPKAVREIPGPESYTGRVIAIDASMCLYQFLIMIRENTSGTFGNLTNMEGQVTSHIVGFLSRTIRLMESGIKPVYVFDGKPPELKLRELEVRRGRRDKAELELEEAKEAGESEQVLRSTKMMVTVTAEQTEQTKRLLRLMGIPVVEAPSEAEATCAALCKAGKVYATATEDADCLTFGTRLLVRNLFAVESQKKQIYEVNLAIALEQLNITMDQFIEFCILCGCDYCESLKGIGPNTAIRLLAQHGSLEKALASLDPAKTPVPPGFRYQAARDFFRECESVDPDSVHLVWKDPDFDGLRKFLVEELGFNEERVERFMERLRAAKTRTKQQPLDRFFGVAKPVVHESEKFDPLKKRGAPTAVSAKGAKAGSPAGAAASGPAQSELKVEVKAGGQPAPEPKPKAKARARGEAKAAGKAKAKAKAKAEGSAKANAPGKRAAPDRPQVQGADADVGTGSKLART